MPDTHIHEQPLVLPLGLGLDGYDNEGGSPAVDTRGPSLIRPQHTNLKAVSKR